MPSQLQSHQRCQRDADDGAAVPRPGHAHGQTLVREWVGPAGEWQRDGKACARDAEQEPDAHHLREVLPGEPRPAQRNRSQQHAGNPNPAGPVPVRKDSDPDPKERSPEQRDRHQKAFLSGGQSEVLGNEDAQGSHENPRHEADFKMEPSGQERRPVAAAKGVEYRHETDYSREIRKL